METFIIIKHGKSHTVMKIDNRKFIKLICLVHKDAKNQQPLKVFFYKTINYSRTPNNQPPRD